MKNIIYVVLVSLLLGCVEEDNIDGLEGISNPPTANAGENVSIELGTHVTLKGNQSFDSDGVIVSYLWTEENDTLGADVMLKNYTRHELGEYRIKLTVTDDDGLTASDTVIVTVTEVSKTADLKSPIANAGENKIINIDEKVNLDGGGSSDPDGKIQFYEWKEGSDIIGTGERVINYSSSVSGVHVIELTVTDNDGLEDKDVVYISVRE